MDKRVWTLYRVSTKGQVNADEDIPMQRNACHRYVENKSNWKITKELYERGVSGWKKSATDRDELVQIKEGAVKGEFDILLIFMSDRLGRKKDESPFIIEFLSKNGVTVHSVNEGELRSVEHTDSLINYIRYWQAEGESIKTSIRVKEQLKQMNEEGKFTGGNQPYGYDLVETDEKHPKKKSNIKKLIINEEQSKVVRLIFELSANKGFGRHKIASYLNERGYLNHLGKKFNDKFIHRLLSNTIYIGKKRYGTKGLDTVNLEYRTQPYNEELRIIDNDLFYKSLEMISKRKTNYSKNEENIKPNSSNVLLSGIITCGYCGKNMRTDFSYKDYTRKSDGLVTRMKTYRYRCTNGKNKIIPHDKIQVGAKSLDENVEKKVLVYIRNLDMSKVTEKLDKIKNEKLSVKCDELKQMESLLLKKQKNLNILNDEIPKSLMGESSFKPDVLNKSIMQIESEINEITNNLITLKEEIKSITENVEEIEYNKNKYIDWEERYKLADLDARKVMISDVVVKVIWKSDELFIDFRLTVEDMISV